ncbi:hypothetical protein [Salibacterium lacus]|uniref:Uncharacterized protein n=1 Tax=Salibacterium lacus TaxID=1898109 RepID=A0ABW5SWQ8_9BACI
MNMEQKVEALQKEIEELTGQHPHIEVIFHDIKSEESAQKAAEIIENETGRTKERLSRGGYNWFDFENSVLDDIHYTAFFKEGYHAGKPDAPTTPVGTRAD